jgi:hypothetical protein
LFRVIISVRPGRAQTLAMVRYCLHHSPSLLQVATLHDCWQTQTLYASLYSTFNIIIANGMTERKYMSHVEQPMIHMLCITNSVDITT